MDASINKAIATYHHAETKELSKKIRQKILDLAYQAGNKGTHVGSSLSMVELLVVLYKDILKIDKNNLSNELRDRFILSKGHGAMAQYAVMHQLGLLSDEDILTFKQNGSSFSTHPYMDVQKGMEFSTGSLGQGLSLGVGSALALKTKKNSSSKIFVMMGDGECDEGSVWESAMSAAHFKLDNLIVIIDRNNLQVDGFTNEVMSQGSLEDKWKSFGWDVYDTDGHDVEKIYQTFMSAIHHQFKPIVIIAHTVKGKGVSFFENQYQWHFGILTDELYTKAKIELEAL